MSLTILSHSPEETQELGKRLGELSTGGEVILLVGSLGAGKTCLAQGIAWGVEVKGYPPSPSFVIIRQYQGRLPFYHVDLYRMEGVPEIAELGLEEHFYGTGVVVVEWAEKAHMLWPGQYLLVNMAYVSETQRRLDFQPQGRRYEEIVERLGGWS